MAANQTLIELPAGTMDGDESPERCAERELMEETGYRAARLRELTAYYAAPGILDEYMHLFVAEGLSLGPPQREADEEIENLIVTWDDALHMVKSRQIRDAKSIAGLLFFALAR
jgi:ADP-ribose pyrophosphatase